VACRPRHPQAKLITAKRKRIRTMQLRAVGSWLAVLASAGG
jgi:hypothetical protein